MIKELGAGVLYMNGKKIADIESAEITVEKKPKNTSKQFTFKREMEVIMCGCHITPWDMIALVTGKRPSNNWMRMHGGIMERKVQIRKARKQRMRK
jgi:hypothetical protein